MKNKNIILTLTGLSLLFILTGSYLLSANDSCYSQHDNNETNYNRCLAQANNGSADALFRMGFLYGHGKGVNIDFSEAMKWYKKAAEKGNASAQNNIGYLYEEGKGVKKDINEAIEWFKKAAEQGNASAQNNLNKALEKLE